MRKFEIQRVISNYLVEFPEVINKPMLTVEMKKLKLQHKFGNWQNENGGGRKN